jgi:hypothetical protein
VNRISLDFAAVGAVSQVGLRVRTRHSPQNTTNFRLRVKINRISSAGSFVINPPTIEVDEETRIATIAGGQVATSVWTNESVLGGEIVTRNWADDNFIRKDFIPAPPVNGTALLQSVDGVLRWIMEDDLFA